VAKAVWGLLVLVILGSGCSGEEPLSTAPAAVKFCHQFHRSGVAVNLTLDVGEPAVAHMTALTGACSPVIGMPCATVSGGVIAFKLMEGEKVLMTTHVPIGGGGEYLLMPVITGLGDIGLRRTPFEADKKCETAEPTLLMRETVEMKRADAGVRPDASHADAQLPDGGNARE
jgi:hypothetical protein